MKYKIRKVRNITDVHQRMTYKGQSYMLNPHEEKVLPHELAQAFLDRIQGKVVEVQLPRHTTGPGHWIANMTGDPSLSPTVKGWASVDGKWRKGQDLENPNLEPRELRFEMKGGHKVMPGDDGEEISIVVPPTTYTIPPFAARAFPKNVADFIIGRVNNVENGRNPAAVRTKSLPAFYPDIEWDASRIRAYLELVDPTAVKGPNIYPTVKLCVAAAKSVDDAMMRLYEYKETMLRALHFRVHAEGDKYRGNFPSETEFNELFVKGDTYTEAMLTTDEEAIAAVEERLADKPEPKPKAKPKTTEAQPSA